MKHQHHLDLGKAKICPECSINNVLRFAELMIERHGKHDESTTLPVRIGEIISLVFMPKCSCGDCDNIIDAESIANYVTDRISQVN